MAKLIEKQFNIFDGHRPKVLFLGNGVNRAFGNASWDSLLDKIKDKKYIYDSYQYNIPMSLKAIMLTNDNIQARLSKLITDKSDEIISTLQDSQRLFIREISGLGFDYIITTNYTYEIEQSILTNSQLTIGQLEKLQNHYEVKTAEAKYLINTFNLVNDIPVWHVHGELRKPNSIILGQTNYGRLLMRCISRVDTGDKCQAKKYEFMTNYKSKKPQKIGSWIDAFILGDVYIVGFGLDFSESDIWWLLDCKAHTSEYGGKTVFYDPIEERTSLIDILCSDCKEAVNNHEPASVGATECKWTLLNNAYNVDVKHLEVIVRNRDFMPFYNAVLNDLKQL